MARSGRRSAQVGRGNTSAHGNSGKRVEKRHHRFEDLAACVLEIDVDAVGTGLLEEIGKPLIETTDTGIEAELTGHVVALLWSPGDTHHPAALDPGDLADDRAHGP